MDPSLPRRSWVYRAAKKARATLDRVIARSSRISNAPVLQAKDFPWTDALKAHWREIRDEAETLLPRLASVPALRLVSPDHRRIAQDDLWKSFFLVGYGYRIEANCARCPRTTALVERIPELNSAFFSILMPGTRIAPHRGPTKGLVTCHLGLMVPPDGACRMRLADQLLGWAEGEWLVFDDTYRHEVRHDGDTPRIVLLIQVKRPLRFPGRLIADLFLAGMRRSPFVQEGRRNLGAWEQAMQAADRPA
ncbi:aspartyl/asparaginyl beta-hydroxylase domain-containing protein [Sphingomonas parva]|uniref:Aspartyl/asparaginyl beta-hydroxylase domain-containing protein n=1 Tax=Sphingomonas parva TaxID=2555898 RepID=A0A4Y8ZWU8_9SPHN|nr:aspartyl/asparaginyl beta-hydroxylase domain-containing protein [Sphingomonas parva]TFI58956.1 aspartyl/asparaginyl beta-hydroxylase domain-containing protein [Sphingomonas parva]